MRRLLCRQLKYIFKNALACKDIDDSLKANVIHQLILQVQKI